MKKISIGDRIISLEYPPYCIAEVGINHNGDVAIAKKMIEVAKKAGADAVKFQTFKAKEFCGDPSQMFTYQSQGKTVTESMLAMFERYEFSKETWSELKAYSDRVGITFFSTPQNRSDLDILLEIGIPVIKIGSDDFTNLPLIDSYHKTGMPIILSCGMSDLAEVHQALETITWFDGYPTILMLCTSQYPTPDEDVNIAKIATLRNAFPGLLVGFSDHTQGSLAAALAVSQGARVFEKHFTLDHNLPGPDHWFSEDPIGLEKWICSIQRADKIMGSPYVRPTSKEKDMRILARRSIVALKDIAPGEILNEENIGLKRPGSGLPPSLLSNLLGSKVLHKIKKGAQLRFIDLGS